MDTCLELKDLKQSVSGNQYVVKEVFQRKYIYRYLTLVVLVVYIANRHTTYLKIVEKGS